MIRVKHIAIIPVSAIRSKAFLRPIWSARNPPEAIPAGLVPIHMTTIPIIVLRMCRGLTDRIIVVCRIANPDKPKPAAKKMIQLPHRVPDTENKAIAKRNNSELKKKVGS